MRALRLFAVLLLACGLGGASAAEVFQFWPGEGAKSAAGFQRMSEHPCGEVAIAEVSKLPTAKKGPLVSELVVELDPQGKVINRWPMPVDYDLRAARGGELLVVVANSGFWIRANGTFRRATAIPPPDKRSPVKCDLTSVFGKSAYAACSVLTDLASHKDRTFGYEGVCT